MTPLRTPRSSRRAAALVGAITVLGLLFNWLVPRNDSVIAGQVTVVLSSGLRVDGNLDWTGRSRLERAIGIADSAGLPLITTRVRRHKPPLLISDSAQRRVVDSLAPALDWVIVSGIATSTRDEAERVRNQISARRVILVTSRLHTRRACAAFEKVGFEVTCASAGRDGPLWKQPYFTAYEAAALLKYWWKGWI